MSRRSTAVLPRRNLVVRTEREAVLVPRFNVKKQQSFAVDGTARGSGRACPYAGPGAVRVVRVGGPAPPPHAARRRRRCRVASAAADRRVRPHLPAAGSAACNDAQARSRRRRTAAAARARPRGTPAPRGPRPGGRGAGIPAEPVQASTSSVCHVCLCNLLRLLLSRRRARRGGASSRRLARGWGAGRGREPGAARD